MLNYVSEWSVGFLITYKASLQVPYEFLALLGSFYSVKQQAALGYASKTKDPAD